jgi:hypothetical protein
LLLNGKKLIRSFKMEFRKLKADEIDVKVGSVTGKGYTLLLYKNARVDMAILDETVGAENWQRDHKEVKGNLYCGIGINIHYNSAQDGVFLEPHYVWKWDCGVESAFGDKEKGEASDSFKRAGFNWGIGRELYTSPLIFVDAETKYDESKKVYKIADDKEQKRSQRMRVKEIDYNDKGEIDRLVIVDNKGVIVFPKNYAIQNPNKEVSNEPLPWEDSKPAKQTFNCSVCDKVITEAEAKYSISYYKKQLCRDCQKKEKQKDVEI